MNAGLKCINKRKTLIVLLSLLVILAISMPLFLFFRLKTESNLVFREAKNVKLALRMLDVEAYGENSSVYDAAKPDGMRAGVKERIREHLEQENCEILLTAYDAQSHTVLGFVYKRGHYQVQYTYDAEKGDVWVINYILHVKTYDGE